MKKSDVEKLKEIWSEVCIRGNKCLQKHGIEHSL